MDKSYREMELFTQSQVTALFFVGAVFAVLNQQTNLHGKQYKWYIQQKHVKCYRLFDWYQENNFEAPVVRKLQFFRDGNFI